MKHLYLLLIAVLLLQQSAQSQTNTNPCQGLAKFEYIIAGNTVKFTSTPNNVTTSLVHYWKLGDGSVSNEANPTHSYINGSYRVVHYIKDTLHQCYDSSVKEFSINVTAVCPQPSFQWRTDSTNNRSVKFYNTTGPLPTIYKFTWKFGDGTVSNDANPTHVYPDTGIYEACLIIENLNGTCSNRICMNIYVRPACDIKPDFSWEVNTTNTRKVTFKNISAPTTSPNVKFTWNFGDGTSATDINPQHEYAKDGIYQVCLRMQVLNSNCVKEICKQVVIRTSCDNLYVKFEWKQDSSHPLRGVQFINESTPLANIQVNARWSFGDGTESTDWNPIHQYNEPGKYKVCLVVKFYDQCYKETCDTIVVPGADTNCTEISTFKMERFTDNRLGFYFNAMYKNPNWSYTWTFGDGTGMKSMDAKHVYDKPGKYTTCLTVYKADYCASTTCMEVIAGNVLCGDFQYRFDYTKAADVPNRVSFHSISNAPLGSIKWQIYNSNSTSSNPVILYGSDPVYTFTQTGLYKVCAMAYTNTGCSKQYCDTLRVDKIVTPAACILSIYPNPANAYIEFDVMGESNGLFTINIFDINGTRRSQFLVAGQQGNNHFRLPVQALSAGYYYIEVIQNNGKVCKGRFQKI